MTDKLCPFRNANLFNVKNAPYNAVGDGVTDDTTAVQAAITAAGVVGGGAIVFFPAGTYLTDKLNLASNIELRGPLTTGTPRPTTWTATLKHKASNPYSHIRADSKTNITFRYLAFDGNGTNQAAGYNIYLVSTPNVLFKDCYFTGYWKNTSTDFPAVQFFEAAGIQIQDSTCYDCDALLVAQTAVSDGLVDNCLITQDAIAGRSESVAFYGTGTNTCDCTNTTFVGTKTGVAFQGTVYSCTASANTFTNCGSVALFDNGAYNCTFTANTIQGGAKSTSKCINLTNDTGTGNVVSYNDIDDWASTYQGAINAQVGCTINNNNIDASDQVILGADNITFSTNVVTNTPNVGWGGHGVYLPDAATGITITGNTITDCNGAGIHVAAAQTGLTVTNNVCSGNTRGINVAVSSTGTYSGNTMTGNDNDPVWDGLTGS